MADGSVVWRTYTVPEGYFGGAVWGSTGAVDLDRRSVYMATGNRLVGAGQKSGMFWAFRAKDGLLVWASQVAPVA